MRLRILAAAAVIVWALLAVGCGGSDESPTTLTGDPIGLQELSHSASTSADATSGRFSFSVEATLTGAGEPFSLSGEGAFDRPSERASFSVDLSGFAKYLGGLFGALAGPKAADLPDFDNPDAWQIEIVQDGDVEYVRLPALDERLPEGKEWVRGAEGSAAGDGFDFGELEDAAETDPREMLDVLRSVTGDIETVGAEELRGVETTHYRAVVDPAELANARDREGRPAPPDIVPLLTGDPGLDEIPLDVWIDAGGLVRKLSMAFSATQSDTTQTGEASMSFELWDYGEPVEIALPPASEVVDASTLKR